MTRPPLRGHGLAEQLLPHSAVRFALVAGLLLTFLSHSAPAQTSYAWTTAVTGNWNDSTKWTPTSGTGTTFPVAGDTATFNSSGQNGAETIYIGQTTTRGQESAASVTFANTGTTTLQGGVSGTGALNKRQLSAGNGPELQPDAGTRTGINCPVDPCRCDRRPGPAAPTARPPRLSP